MEKQNTAPAADATESRIDIATVVLGMTANNTVGAIEAAISILTPIVDPDIREACAALHRLAIKKQEQQAKHRRKSPDFNPNGANSSGGNDESIKPVYAIRSKRAFIGEQRVNKGRSKDKPKNSQRKQTLYYRGHTTPGTPPCVLPAVIVQKNTRQTRCKGTAENSRLYVRFACHETRN